MQSTKIDLIEVVANGIIQVREATVALDSAGVEISKTYKRWCLTPGQDIREQAQAVQNVCAAAWTPQVVAAYQQLMTSKGN
jgi:hypothetical protein